MLVCVAASPLAATMLNLQHSARAGPACRSRATTRKLCVSVSAAGSTYGNNFRVTTFGESHGKGVGCVIDGVPPRLAITEDEIQLELDRRKPGQSIITTPRKEDDIAEILSGVVDGVTLGTPIAIVVRNKDQKSQDYSEMSVAYRPSHADATYDFKYGIRAVAGGGRSSARETIGRVAAGAVAKKLLKVIGDTEVRWTGGARGGRQGLEGRGLGQRLVFGTPRRRCWRVLWRRASAACGARWLDRTFIEK